MRGFRTDYLKDTELDRLTELARVVRGDILKMTTIAQSGHPGGAMSSADIFLVVYNYANIDPKEPDMEGRDYIVVSHGHTSAGVYAVLARMGFFNIDDVISYFRLAGSPFEGHVEREIPGIEWTTGNLGQGLSAGCGFALASKLKGYRNNIFVIMGDAEQAKGQVAEARRFAKKFDLNNITVLIDFNRRQISGKTFEIMPVNIADNYRSDGWKVIEIDGHDPQAIYSAIVESKKCEESPVAIIANTVMGKGVSFMEGNEAFHGKPLSFEELRQALLELDLPFDLNKYIERRNTKKFPVLRRRVTYPVKVNTGEPIVYKPEDKLDNRTALGKALLSVARATSGVPEATPVLAFDCDLKGSVKLNYFAKEFPEFFIESGVTEHNTATVAGSASLLGYVSVFGDFGVFGVDETYNQQRLNDINKANLKLFVTHLGIDVGEDGKTHHCVDYLGAMKNLYGFKAVVPACPNQTDRIVRYVLSCYGNFLVGVGRSKIPVILKEDGTPFFDEHYTYKFGKFDILRRGERIALVAYGTTASKAVRVWELLKEHKLDIEVINIASPNYITEELGKHLLTFDSVYTYEDHNKYTGLGSSLAMSLIEMGYKGHFYSMGLSDYAPSGRAEDLFSLLGLSAEKARDFILSKEV